jgi:endonuclease/exonuclease/phosphatase family metal-dependent hydrolase
MDDTILVCQMNILAPLWVGEIYTYLPCYDLYIDPHRILRTLKYLKKFDADLYCLSEVEESQLDDIKLLFPDYDVIYTSNAYGFWSEWLTSNPPLILQDLVPIEFERTHDIGSVKSSPKTWVSNGTCILIKSSKFKIKNTKTIKFNDYDGCRATLATLSYCDIYFVVVSVHFDTTDEKYIEAQVLLEILEDIHRKLPEAIYIISGDFNFVDVSAFEAKGYIHISDHSIQTTPIPQGMIDHTLVKGAIALEGEVHSLGSICSTVSINGSDHYATTSKIYL